MEGISLTYEAAVTGVGNYLSAAAACRINNYQMKMLEYNTIPGLLPARGSMLNGVYRINYEIDGTRRLAAALAGGGLRGEEAKKFMGDLLHTLSGLGEYFLSYRQCLLDVDYIYINNRGRAKLVYLPLSGQVVTDEETVRQFCRKLFAEYFTADGDPFFLKLLRYVSMQDFSFAGLLACFEEDWKEQENRTAGYGQEAAALRAGQDLDTAQSKENLPPQQGMQNPKLFRKGENPWASKAGQNPQTAGGINDALAKEQEMIQDDAAYGFAVPGGGSFAVPKEMKEKAKQEKKPQKEKGGSLLRSLLSGKKGKAAEEKAAKGAVQKSLSIEKGAWKQEINTERKSREENNSGDWHGTVMLEGGDASSTVMMGMNAAPYLLYQGMKIPLEHFPFTLGKENTDFIFEKNVVSRMHASIGCRGEGYFVMDENSKNHTWLNGRQLSPYTETQLQDGDTLRLANEIMTFHI